eukprot:149258_1
MSDTYPNIPFADLEMLDIDLKRIDYKSLFESLYDPDIRDELQALAQKTDMVVRKKMNEFSKDGKITPEEISKAHQLGASFIKNNSSQYSVSIKSLPNKCIHFQSKYNYSSKIFIDFVNHCLTNAESCCNSETNYSKISCYARVVCLQCCLQFVICTKKFKLISSQMQNNVNVLFHYQNKQLKNDDIKPLSSVLFQSTHIFVMLEAILSNNTICKYFCSTNRRKNVKILLTFLRQLCIIFLEKDLRFPKIDPFSIISNLISNLMSSMKKNHWKYFVKLELPTLLCDIICSDIFKKPYHLTQDINNNIYQLFEYQIVMMYIDIMLLLKHKYSSLIQSDSYNDMIEKLNGYNEQTVAIADQLTIDIMIDKLDVPCIFGNSLSHVILQKISTRLRVYRKMGQICSNTKCRKYKPSEPHMQMQRKFKKCGGCLLALYCSKKCQKY